MNSLEKPPIAVEIPYLSFTTVVVHFVASVVWLSVVWLSVAWANTPATLPPVRACYQCETRLEHKSVFLLDRVLRIAIRNAHIVE